jgi:hypothetical protein
MFELWVWRRVRGLIRCWLTPFGFSFRRERAIDDPLAENKRSTVVEDMKHCQQQCLMNVSPATMFLLLRGEEKSSSGWAAVYDSANLARPSSETIDVSSRSVISLVECFPRRTLEADVGFYRTDRLFCEKKRSQHVESNKTPVFAFWGANCSWLIHFNHCLLISPCYLRRWESREFTMLLWSSRSAEITTGENGKILKTRRSMSNLLFLISGCLKEQIAALSFREVVG